MNRRLPAAPGQRVSVRDVLPKSVRDVPAPTTHEASVVDLIRLQRLHDADDQERRRQRLRREMTVRIATVLNRLSKP